MNQISQRKYMDWDGKKSEDEVEGDKGDSLE